MIDGTIREMLVDFEKRMKFLNFVKFITQRTVRDNIKNLFDGNSDRLDNLILMVMLYIMDYTLRYDEKCGMNDIENFISRIISIYGIDEEYSSEITKYILIDVLQNGGRLREFEVFNSDTENFAPASCCIISENNGSYKLTDEALDFLFRTKEVDSELDFSVSRFKLNEFIKRGNYSKALVQSRELVSRIRGLKTGMDDFMLRCRENISAVSVDEYEEIVLRVKGIFEDEQKQLEDIRNIVYKRLDEILDTIQKGEVITKANETEAEIREILKNIDITIKEQNAVYNKKFLLSESYGRALDEDFTYYLSKRYNFEEEVLKKAQKWNAKSATELCNLFIPLLKPRFEKFFSLENLYAGQKKLIDKPDDDFLDISVSEEPEESREEVRNRRFSNIVRLFAEFAFNHSYFKSSEMLDSFSKKDRDFICEENAVFDVLLKLYGLGEINIEKWKNAQAEIIVPSGEFDLNYCLSLLNDRLLEIKSIKISKTDEIFEMRLSGGLSVSITDFGFEVKK